MMVVAIALLATISSPGNEPAVTYEAFGATGDGLTDDLPAISRAHAHANENALPVRSKPGATYHLGRKAITAVIMTNTDWTDSNFIIDDSQGVDDHRKPVFDVRSSLQPLDLNITSLAKGQQQLNVRPPVDCLVRVENRNRNIYIRRGLNQNSGTRQREVFILRTDGTVIGDIQWDYETITRIDAHPIDPEPLVVRGGHFTNIANREKGTSYWQRNIRINRSNTEINGITMRVTGETDVGQPYGGFLNAQRSAHITLRNCTIDGRKTYQKIGAAGRPVAMGTYGYLANEVVNFRMVNCRMDDIHDRSRWGIMGMNFMKNILIEDCELSRVDVHQGVAGVYIIRRTTLGHAGFNAIGHGRLLIEDSTIHGRHMIWFREDYGSNWDGQVVIKNSRWIPPGNSHVIFGMRNDGAHDFGFPCTMPRTIRIDGLFIDDSNLPADHQGVLFFNDPTAGNTANRPFPYQTTERLEIRNLKTASGRQPGISNNPALTEKIQVIRN
jgi:hypothetical protein